MDETSSETAPSPPSSDATKKASTGIKSRLKRWAISLSIIYLLVILFLVCAESYLVYPALMMNDGTAAKDPGIRRGFIEHQKVETVDNVLIDCFHYCPYEQTSDSRGVLLVCHGNGEWIGRMAPLLISLGETYDISVVCFDYRGYGQSDGFPNEEGILRDADTAYQAVIGYGYAPEEIIVYGRSIGGGPSCYIAANHKIGGLILQNTFSSLVDVAASKYFWLPVRLIMRNRFPSAERLSKYQGPLLQTHGTADRVVPFRLGKKLFESAGTDESQKDFLIQEDGTHTAPISKEFHFKINLFLERVLGKKER